MWRRILLSLFLPPIISSVVLIVGALMGILEIRFESRTEVLEAFLLAVLYGFFLCLIPGAFFWLISEIVWKRSTGMFRRKFPYVSLGALMGLIGGAAVVVPYGISGVDLSVFSAAGLFAGAVTAASVFPRYAKSA